MPAAMRLVIGNARLYRLSRHGMGLSGQRRCPPFEKLSLEGFQSGLSWRTILAKRKNFRAAFENFNFHKVARIH
jgi:DNA-3-methyladenine glycosylase I